MQAKHSGKSRKRSRSNVRAISPWLEAKILERERAARERVLEQHLANNTHPADFPTQHELEALERCFERAKGCSGGQGRVRRFLLSWQSTRVYGGFDVTDLWNLDQHYGGDLMTVLKMIYRGPGGFYPSHYGYHKEIEALRARYQPGEYVTEKCHACGDDVGHVCDKEGHERRQAEDRREAERERIMRDSPYGDCSKCGYTIYHQHLAAVGLCDLCDDDARAVRT
jgi:hypothetical protein